MSLKTLVTDYCISILLFTSPFLGSFTLPHGLGFPPNVTKHVFLQFLRSDSHPYHKLFL